jgi:methionine aminopeptidase, type II
MLRIPSDRRRPQAHLGWSALEIGGALNEEVVRKYLKAGEIAKKVKARASREVVPGARVLDVVTSIESYIKELGAEPAFPVNISINNEAAHRTAYIDDTDVIPEDSVVKIDIGVHVDGYIADTAITVSFAERYRDLLEAVREALDKALKAVKPGVKASDIGSVIEKAIKSKGFKPVKNLSGHSLAEYTIHAGETIPNYREPLNFSRLTPGTAYAIEPFASTGRGVVHEEKRVSIYSIKRSPKCEELPERQIISEIYKKVRTLPFSERWFPELATVVGGVSRLREIFKGLSNLGCLIAYPVLSDIPGSRVAQFEETVLLLKDGSVLVTTQ